MHESYFKRRSWLEACNDTTIKKRERTLAGFNPRDGMAYPKQLWHDYCLRLWHDY